MVFLHVVVLPQPEPKENAIEQRPACNLCSV